MLSTAGRQDVRLRFLIELILGLSLRRGHVVDCVEPCRAMARLVHIVSIWEIITSLIPDVIEVMVDHSALIADRWQAHIFVINWSLV